MTAWIGAAFTAVLVLALFGGWRGHRELRRWLGADPNGARRSLRIALLVLATGLVGLALDRSLREAPQLTGAGADVVLAIDVSRSMDTRDVPPSRLRRAIRLAERTVQVADGIRIGLVVFAGDAFPVLPLTQDWDAILTYLQSFDSDLISLPGTDVARALVTAGGVFDPRSSRPRTVLLFPMASTREAPSAMRSGSFARSGSRSSR